MTDYKEEQANEIEALESIYPDELTIVDTEPNYHFQISIDAHHEEWNQEDQDASCVLEFKYRDTYPDELPVMDITESDNLEDNEADTLLKFMKEQAEENIGMVMVFTVVAAVQEKLQTMMEERTAAIKAEKERKLKEVEDAEKQRFMGTHVTIETFLAWKAKFDADMAEIKKKRGEVEQEKNLKMTGYELFMTDNTLDDSDVKFLEEEGESVAVDESLFQDLDDLDLDAEDDPDYVPAS